MKIATLITTSLYIRRERKSQHSDYRSTPDKLATKRHICTRLTTLILVIHRLRDCRTAGAIVQLD